MPITDEKDEIEAPVGRLLRSLRTWLGLDVAFVSQLDDRTRVFRYVDSDVVDCGIAAGRADPAEESYCRYVVAGDLPEFLPDPREHPLSAGLGATHTVPVGTHLSVPIRFSDGTVYGTLCSFARDVRPGLSEHDLVVLRLMADVVAGYLEERESERLERARRRRLLRELTPGRDLQVLFQPIVDLSDGAVVGAEALARFPSMGQDPARVFASAWQLGVGVELELAAMREALTHLPLLPGGVYLSVNVSPATVTAREFHRAVADVASDRLILEITEHAAVADYDALLAAVAPLTRAGVRLAIDDAGTGFSGLHHILRLSPDIIKLDAALVRDVNLSPAKQAMISALMTFTARMRVPLVAEAIETAEELAALRILGVGYGQGYHLGRPERLGARQPTSVMTSPPGPR